MNFPARVHAALLPEELRLFRVSARAAGYDTVARLLRVALARAREGRLPPPPVWGTGYLPREGERLEAQFLVYLAERDREFLGGWGAKPGRVLREAGILLCLTLFGEPEVAQALAALAQAKERCGGRKSGGKVGTGRGEKPPGEAARGGKARGAPPGG